MGFDPARGVAAVNANGPRSERAVSGALKLFPNSISHSRASQRPPSATPAARKTRMLILQDLGVQAQRDRA
jgi:hypothetical protein